MNKKQKVSFAVIGVVLVSLAVTCVSAASWTSNTPLFTMRMEQASSKMNFLPTEKIAFAYATESGYNLNCNAAAGTGELLGNCTDYDTTCLLTCPDSCAGTCDTCGGYTCDETSCQPTCPAGTCSATCWDTCPVRTCIETLCHCPP
ncbi:MAG: hypothetical protein HXS48_14125 [Theionarchaea archaeon]|nr:MAG: hypothetical protein AYK19_20655 [Theionarchaea archaeon DG-70-1]MBU7028068.1 hypothetical protein [Theionarchaea archaeon]